MTRKSSAIVLLAAVFLAGVATTLALQRLAEHRPDRPDFRGGRVPERMIRTLDLTEEQRSEVEAVLERRRANTEEVMADMLPALRSQMDSMHAEIERVLTPEQRELFLKSLREDRERFRRGGPRRPPQGLGPR